MVTNTTRPSITRFILYPLVGVVVILLAGFAALSLQFLSGVHKTATEETLRTTQTAFQLELDERVDKLTLALFQLSNNPELVKEFLSRDRIGLQEAALDTYEEFETQHNVTHFYFTDMDRTNFLRVHKPERYGDVIGRATMLRAVASGEVTHGIELGALGTLTLRVVYPWRVDGELIGYIELGEEIEHLLRTISGQFKPTLTVAIQKQYLDRDSWRTGMEMLGREAIWDQFESYILLEPEQTTLAGQSIIDSLHKHQKNSPDNDGESQANANY